MLNLMVNELNPGRSLDQLEEFCSELASFADAAGYARLAAALHNVGIEARAALELEAELAVRLAPLAMA